MSNAEEAGYKKFQGWLQVVRDSAILLVLASLLLFPSFVNDRLTKAGFTKASLAGFEWERTLETAVQETKSATESVATLEKQLEASRAELEQLRASPAISPQAREQISRLSTNIGKTTAATSNVRDRLNKSLGAQEAIIQNMKVAKQTRPVE